MSRAPNSHKYCFFSIKKPEAFPKVLGVAAGIICCALFAILVTSFVIIGDRNSPMYQRVRVSGFPDDAAILMDLDDGGRLSLHVCNGTVPFECSECDSDDDFVSDPSASSAGSKLGTTSAPLFPQQHLLLRRRSAVTQEDHPFDCPCGVKLLFREHCPLIADGVSSATGLNCPKIQSVAYDMFPVEFAYIIVGPILPAIFIAGTYFSLVLGRNACDRSIFARASYTAVLVLGGVVPTLMVILVSVPLISSSGQLRDVGKVRCEGGKNIGDDGFYPNSVKTIHSCAIAGAVFFGVSGLVGLVSCLGICFVPAKFGNSYGMDIDDVDDGDNVMSNKSGGGTRIDSGFEFVQDSTSSPTLILPTLPEANDTTTTTTPATNSGYPTADNYTANSNSNNNNNNSYSSGYPIGVPSTMTQNERWERNSDDNPDYVQRTSNPLF